jgi:hypothetical protein
MAFFLAIASISLLGTLGVLRSWPWYEVFEGVPDPAYLLFRGVFLFLGWLTAAFALWKSTLWARNFCGMMAVIHLVWFWIDRLWLTHPDLPFKQHIMEIGFSVLCFPFIITALWFLNRDASKLATVEDDIEGEK